MIEVKLGDCIYYFSDQSNIVYVKRGPIKINSSLLATVIRGYMPADRSCTIQESSTLPYINGCSTRQIFSPERIGDPTMQLLIIPPHTSEQAHHIHSTVRVVYVYSGSGNAIVGTPNKKAIEPLYRGKIVLLHKMCPHHFETNDDSLIVIPLHIFSSTQSEYNHPMFNGTYKV